MPIVNQLRSFLGAIPRRNLRRQARAFLQATADCRATQHRVLQELLRLNDGSRFSAEHGLQRAETPADLRRCLPVSRYDTFAPYIERLKEGDHAALLGPDNRLLMFTLSSGTTAGSKFIPITERFLRDYRRGWQSWGILTFDDHPVLNARHILQLSSHHDKFRTPGGTPCGNISGLVAAMQKRIVQTMYTVPSTVARITDADAKNYTALRLALADDQIGLVMTANPSTLIHLAKMAEEHREELIRDIAEGTLSRRFDVSSEVRRLLARRISRRRKQRARQLEQIAERTGQFRPADYWPKLAVAAVWTGGSAGAYLPALRRLYGETLPVRDHGLSASEGRMTIPIADGASDGILDITSHFFEFIPVEEYESAQPVVLEAHELQEDREYYILLTTPSGLYRYDICDVVRCTGFYGTTPLLQFRHKGAHISNITGEKVSESQVVEAVRSSVERLQLELKHFTVAPVWGDPPYYQLLAEQHDVPSPEVAERLQRRIDIKLQRLNCEYWEKRRSGRLGRMQFRPLPEGTWQRFTRQRQEKLGGSLEQYKHPCLVPDLKFTEQLLGEFSDHAA